MTANATEQKTVKNRKKKIKRNACVLCHDSKEFWTTQAQFWQWVRDLKVVKMGDYPLRGRFASADEEKMVILSNMVLNSANKNHLAEALYSKRFMKPRKLK